MLLRPVTWLKSTIDAYDPSPMISLKVDGRESSAPMPSCKSPQNSENEARIRISNATLVPIEVGN